MATESIATRSEQSPSEEKGLYFTLGNTSLELTGTDASEMLADAYVWRTQVRSLLTLAESMAERSLNEPSIAYAIENAMGAARILSELAEATLDHACRLRGVDYDGTGPIGCA
ncbi:hypothetical protein EJMOOK_08495 [Rhodanobacter sp. Root179]